MVGFQAMKARWFELKREQPEPHDGGEPFTPLQQTRFTLAGLFVVAWPFLLIALVLLLLFQILS